MKNKVVYVTLIYFISLCLILLIDYFNFLSFITSKLNHNYLSIIVNSLTTIYLFFITYYLIDKRLTDNENEKKKNKKMALNIMLKETYNSCKESIELYCDDCVLTKSIVPKVDFNIIEDPFIESQKNKNFIYDSKIMELVSDGIMSKDELKQYLEIKNDFASFINLKVTLFDIKSVDIKKNHRALVAKNSLDNLEKKLRLNIDNALKKVNKNIGD